MVLWDDNVDWPSYLDFGFWVPSTAEGSFLLVSLSKTLGLLDGYTNSFILFSEFRIPDIL